ncbi:MAG: hypothetical protein ACRCWB_11720 [Enterovibrio sp.]
MSNISKTVTRLRNAKALGISLKSIAAIAEVDYQKVYWLERCHGVRRISDREVERVAAALDEIKAAL